MNIIFVQYLQNESIIVSSLWPDKQSVMIVHLPKTHAGQTNFPILLSNSNTLWQRDEKYLLCAYTTLAQNPWVPVVLGGL